MANDLIPYKRPADDVTGLATAAIVGKRCVQISGAKDTLVASGQATGLDATGGGGTYKVSHPSGAGANGGAAKRVFGVAKYDAPVGGFVGIAREGILPIFCSAALTAGQLVEVAADGTVIPLAAGVPVGMAVNDAAINTDAEIAFYSYS